MMATPGFLAGAFRIAEENSLRGLIPPGSTLAQVVIYAGALLVVALAVFVWAAFFRKQRHRRRHSPHHHSRPGSRRHQHSEEPERPRTLAETGGLPPLRNQQPPPSE
jgi:hypothetical protein